MNLRNKVLRVIISLLLIILCFLLQCTVFKKLSFGGIVPNLLIIITSAFGFMRGKRTGLMVGLISGLLVDIFFGSYIGLYAMIYMYIGYANGAFNRIFYPEDIKLPVALILFSDMLYGFICYFALFLMRGKFDFPYYFVHIILPEIVYTIGITLLLYPCILLLNNKLEEKEKRSERKFV